MQPRYLYIYTFGYQNKHRGPKIEFIDRLRGKFPRGKCRCQATIRNKNGCVQQERTHLRENELSVSDNKKPQQRERS